MSLVQNFEGGTDGVTLTAGIGGNTGTAGNSYFNGVQIGTNAICQFAAAAAYEGSIGLRCATRATGTNSNVTWVGQFPSSVDSYERFFIRCGVQSGNNGQFVRWYDDIVNSYVGLSWLAGANAGKIAIQLNGVTQGSPSTTVLSAATWYRIEAHVHASTTVAFVEVKIFTDPTSATPAETFGASTTFAWTANVGTAYYGVLAVANWPDSTHFLDMDAIVSNAASYVGPLAGAGTTVTAVSALSNPGGGTYLLDTALTANNSALNTSASTTPTIPGTNIDKSIAAVAARNNPRVTAAGVSLLNAIISPSAAVSTAVAPAINGLTPISSYLSVDTGSGLLPQLAVFADVSSSPTTSSRSWTGITAGVRSLSFTRSGRSDELQRTSPGTLTMTLDNRSDAATNLGLKKAQWIRVAALWAGVQYPLWQGLITSLTRQWPSAGRDATLTVQAADALYLLRIAQMRVWGVDRVVPLSSFPLERADQRIGRICASFARGGGNLAGTLDPQTDTLDAVPNVSATTDALSIALAVEGSDNGLLIADAAGTVSYQGRQWRILNAASSVLTVGEAGGVEVSYDDSVSYEDDDSRLTNIVNVTPLGASTPQSAEDVASEGLYWGRHNQTVDRSLLSSDANLALSAAQYLVTRYKDPPPRIPALTVNMVTVPSAQKPTVLSLANSQRVTWKRAAATPIQTDGYVEQIQHTLQPGSSWTMTLQLSPAALETAWILGDATYGQLGTTSLLSY